MKNLFREFQRLLPDDPEQYVEVVVVDTNGTSIVELPTGERFRVEGDSVAAGANAFIQGGRIIGEAPSLPYYSATV